MQLPALLTVDTAVCHRAGRTCVIYLLCVCDFAFWSRCASVRGAGVVVEACGV